MSLIRKFVAAGAAVLCALSVSACGNSAPDGAVSDDGVAGTLTLRGAGSTFIAPLVERWIADYRSARANVRVTYDAVGSGEGIERFIAGGVDFGASDAAMNDREIARVQPPAGHGVRMIPVVAGEVVLAYNVPGAGDGLRLPRGVYADIFLGRIARWDDPRIVAANPDVHLPGKPIQVVARRDSSGTTFAFTNHLSAVSTDWRQGPGAAKLIDWPGAAMIALGNEGVAQRLKITQYSIGYLEYGFAKRLGLQMAVLENRAGAYVMPGADGGAAALDAAVAEVPADLRLFLPDPAGADAYPMVSLVWLLLPRTATDPVRQAALAAAVDWQLGAGQRVAEAMGYVPLPDSLVGLARRALNAP